MRCQDSCGPGGDASGEQTIDSRSNTCGRSRREFFTGLVALGICTVSPVGTLLAKTAEATAKPGLIDLHHHILPPFYLAEVRDLILSSWRLNSRRESYLPARVLEWSPQNALAEMDKNGVATSVVSISIPGVWFGGAQAARTRARKCNEYAAQLAQDHPGRFRFFASVPLPDTEGSLQEIVYALDVLKASGIIFMTNYADKWPGDPAFAPVFEELNRRKAIVYFHPSVASCCRDLIPNVPYVLTEVPQGVCCSVLHDHYDDPPDSALALRFLGAVHRLVLQGKAPQLAACYPSAGGDSNCDDLWPRFRGVVQHHEAVLRELVHRPVQTNEVGRCAALLGGFLEVARQTGLPLRLLEVGAAGGLILRWDQYWYEAGHEGWGNSHSPVRITGAFGGEHPRFDVLCERCRAPRLRCFTD